MKLNSLVIVTSFVALVISFWKRNDLPSDIAVLPATTEEPRQTQTGERPFETLWKGVRYEVEPQYDYDLTGIVVSFRHHEGNSRMHRRAKDHLNMLDVCVVWGGNAGNPALQKIDFWNGIFTCNVKTRDRDAWEAFSMDQLSNNHLISDDEYIRDRVRDIAIGDQVRVRGYLASYGSSEGGKRGTSTTRTDTGDGACETIYVERFDILEEATSPWRTAMYLSLIVLLAAIVAHYMKPYRPHGSGDS